MVGICIDNGLYVKYLAVLYIEGDIRCYLISFRSSNFLEEIRSVRKADICRSLSGDPGDLVCGTIGERCSLTCLEHILFKCEFGIAVVDLLGDQCKLSARKLCSVIFTADCDLGDLDHCPCTVIYLNIIVGELVLLKDCSAVIDNAVLNGEVDVRCNIISCRSSIFADGVDTVLYTLDKCRLRSGIPADLCVASSVFLSTFSEVELVTRYINNIAFEVYAGEVEQCARKFFACINAADSCLMNEDLCRDLDIEFLEPCERTAHVSTVEFCSAV